jgi:hypothetical protein
MIESKNDLSGYQLAYELFSSLIILDENNHISFAGDVILEALKLSDIDIYKIESDKFSCKEGRNLLDKILKVREQQEANSFKFKKNNQEFILLPSNIYDSNFNLIKNSESLYENQNKSVFLSLKNAVDHICNIQNDLKGRVKELECLYNISHEVQTSKSIFEACEKSVEHIKNGFQYSDEATVIIEYGNMKFMSAGGSEKNIKNILSDENILKNSKKIGEIKVIYHKKLPFLQEEVQLLKEISRKFTKTIEKEYRTQTLEKQQKILM